MDRVLLRKAPDDLPDEKYGKANGAFKVHEFLGLLS
jgi:hypothetical protein